MHRSIQTLKRDRSDGSRPSNRDTPSEQLALGSVFASQTLRRFQTLRRCQTLIRFQTLTRFQTLLQPALRRPSVAEEECRVATECYLRGSICELTVSACLLRWQGRGACVHADGPADGASCLLTVSACLTVCCGGRDEARVYMLMDPLMGGELFVHLGVEEVFNEERARFYTACVILGLDHMHKKGVIYRDLKLEK
eukprot:247799-Prorocentrum_minimum.AAC.3